MSESRRPLFLRHLDQYFLSKMADGNWYLEPDETYRSFSFFTNRQISRDLVRGVLRDLTNRGYCKYSSGLWRDDQMGGAGYGITKKGIAYLKELGGPIETEMKWE